MVGQQLLELGLVDTVRDPAQLVLVAQSLGQGEGRGDRVQDPQGEEGPHPRIDGQVGHADAEGGQRDDEADLGLEDPGSGVIGDNIEL